MSLIFCDGFDDGLTALGKWDLSYNAQGVTTSGARNGSCLRMVDQGGSVKRSLGSADEHATVTVGLAIKGDGSGTFLDYIGAPGHINFWSDNGTTPHISVYLKGGTTDPKVAAYRGNGKSGSTFLGEASVPLWNGGVYFYVEVQVVLHDSTGSVTVNVNGTTYLNLTGIDTKNGGTKSVIDSVLIANAGANNWASIDDLYITNGAGSTNTGFLGDVAVETLLPNGNGSTNQFINDVGNSTNNYTHTNEAAPDTTTYSQSATVSEQDLYAMADLTRTSGTIYGVATTSYAQASDGGARSMKSVVKSAAAVATSAAKTLVTTYRPIQSVFETDPNTSVAWTVAGANAAESGVEVA